MKVVICLGDSCDPFVESNTKCFQQSFLSTFVHILRANTRTVLNSVACCIRMSSLAKSGSINLLGCEDLPQFVVIVVVGVYFVAVTGAVVIVP